jgi:cardiolipin synthase
MWGKRLRTRFILPGKPPFPTEICMVLACVNDWVRGKKQISKAYIEMLKQAQQSVIIMSSYIFCLVFLYDIEIYEYKKIILHGKLSTSDERLVIVGSYNINNVSAYAAIELNLDVLNESFAKKTEAVLQKIIREDCIRITEAE